MIRRGRVARSRGFTLLEAMGVVALAAIVMAVVMALVPVARNNVRGAAFLSDLQTLVDRIRQDYTLRDGYVGLTATDAIARGLVPSALQNGTTAIVSPWGGWVTLASDAGAANLQFQVWIQAPPATACRTVALELIRAGWATRMYRVGGTSQDVYSGTDAPSADKHPVMLERACGGTTAPNYWIMYAG